MTFALVFGIVFTISFAAFASCVVAKEADAIAEEDYQALLAAEKETI